MKTQLPLVLSWLVLSVLSAQGFALQQAYRINGIGDIIEQWTPDQHLYVKGDLGVGGAQYAKLEQWLDENAAHWTVVLMKSASMERYEAANGIRYTGMDAVEHALGYGLANRTGFGALEHPKTGESDGAVFVLFLTERKFSYYASDAQDRRGLGESRWGGELDQPAFRAMRGGGRILDAVKDTVTSINKRLERSIDAEAKQEARSQRQRERALAELRVDLQHARESIQTVVDKANALKTTPPGAEGAMAQPPIDDWNRRLTAIDEDVTQENVRASSQQTREVMAEIDRYLNDFAQYEAFPSRLSELGEQINSLSSELDGVAAEQADAAGARLMEAVAAREQGDPAFIDLIRDAQQTLQAGHQAVQRETEDRARAIARRRLIWTTAITTVALTLAALLGFLVWLNRRRVPARQEAFKALVQRQKSVRAEMDRVLELFERSREVLGPKEKAATRGYEGKTGELTDDTFQKVDDLLIMSNEVDRVMDEAEALIRPADIMGWVQNQFSATRYERGINRMSGEPLRFHEDQGIPAILRAGETDENGKQLEVVSLTFEQVMAAFRQRSDEVTQALSVIETSLLEVNDGLSELNGQIDKATDVDRQMATQAENDGFFPVPQFFQVLLPSAEADHDKADEIAPSDPVQAVQRYIPDGLRKIDEALQIATIIDQARDKTFPQFDQHAPRLQTLSYDTGWIQMQVDALGERADTLFKLAADRSVAADIAPFREEIRALGERVAQCADLAEELQMDTAPTLDELRDKIESARQQISQQLSLPIERSLHERQTDPDSRLAAAREQLAAAKAALQHGGIDAAKSAAESLRSVVDTGQQIVAHSLEVLQQFASSLGDARNEHRAVQSSLPQIGELTQRMSEEFAESALRIQASDSAYDDPRATLASRLQDAQTDLNDSWNLLEQADAVFRDGKILEADGRIQVARGKVGHGDQLLNDIRDHVDRLQARTRENATTVANIDQRARSLEPQLSDARTTRPTLDEFSRLQDRIQQASRDVVEASEVRDPFQNAQRLAELGLQVTRVEGLMAADREAHAEANRAVTGAVNQLASALRFVEQARRDGIPDSDLTVRTVREIQRLESEVDRVRQRIGAQHEDWSIVDEEAARLNAELGTLAARLKGELDRAEKSVAALQSASREVFDASRWTGRFGTRVKGSPGSSDLERARQALTGGNYELMIQLSQAAAMAAQFAIQRAQREVQRQEREEARRAEATRRAELARRRRSSPSITFGSGGGGFSGGGGSFSGGGGGGSSSGFGRSGW